MSVKCQGSLTIMYINNVRHTARARVCLKIIIIHVSSFNRDVLVRSTFTLPKCLIILNLIIYKDILKVGTHSKILF